MKEEAAWSWPSSYVVKQQLKAHVALYHFVGGGGPKITT